MNRENREDERKLRTLRAIAREAFATLDRGRGIELKNERELATFISRLGRRAAEAVKRRRHGG
jgi:hypothetical protein